MNREAITCLSAGIVVTASTNWNTARPAGGLPLDYRSEPGNGDASRVETSSVFALSVTRPL